MLPVTLRVVTGAPAVSVVLPVWNGERFLAQAIESVLGQTLSSLELLLVDDGSTDGTQAIARAYEARDPRVHVLCLQHGGLARALNAGIEIARGRYVARMDADDASLPLRLERQVAYLESHPDCVAIGSAIDVIDEHDQHLGVKTFAATNAEIVAALIGGSSSPLAHPTVMARREALLAVGGYHLHRYPSEDLDLWMKLSPLGQLANIPEPLLLYRRHPGAVSVRERDTQIAMSALIVNEARKRRGLRPLRRRIFSTGTSNAARYHFECARFALLAGPRAAALRHAGASIAFEPLWAEPYAALVACALPRRTLQFMVQLRARLRSRRS
jgi:glycosyltransferase involved in cell wall biosynthesis